MMARWSDYRRRMARERAQRKRDKLKQERLWAKEFEELKAHMDAVHERARWKYYASLDDGVPKGATILNEYY